ncbi:MAG: hypothetical protein M3082_19620 [Candidatus Dormibacteraeota bacterium]|nr:hypothetical protein [Candidatus Dormibacteraeota bacterium]
MARSKRDLLSFLRQRRWLKVGAVGAALLAVLAVAIAAFLAMQVPFQGPAANVAKPSVDCSPAPCANVQGYTLWVSNLKFAGNLVSMEISFKNSSGSTHASPEDVQLIDSKLHASNLVTDSPGCLTWDRHEFNNGAAFGPLKVCFRVSTTEPPLVLRWSPDMGLICCRTDIKLT